MTTAIKYETVIPGYVVAREFQIAISKYCGTWNVQQNDKHIKGFDTLREAKAFVAETMVA